MAADQEPEQAPPERIKPSGNMRGATAAGRRRRGFPAGCPSDSALTQNSSAASLGV